MEPLGGGGSGFEPATFQTQGWVWKVTAAQLLRSCQWIHLNLIIHRKAVDYSQLIVINRDDKNVFFYRFLEQEDTRQQGDVCVSHLF